jgi:hypothetical protein
MCHEDDGKQYHQVFRFGVTSIPSGANPLVTAPANLHRRATLRYRNFRSTEIRNVIPQTIISVSTLPPMSVSWR